MADLLGGTTGQVLAKASNTDMDFSWVAQDDSNAIQNAIVDAKGDLIAATAADTPARLAVGTNGQVLTADSTAATGLAWATPSAGGASMAAGKNAIINGAFDYWQRGTSGFTAGGAFNADRWKTYYDGAGSTATITQQPLTAGAIPTIDSPFCYQWNQTVAGSGATTNQVYQLVEDVCTYAGQTAVLSFYAKSDATRTAVAPTVNQNFGSGGSATVGATVTATSGNPTNLTTSWQRFSYTVVLASITGKTVGTSSYLEVSIKLPINTTQVSQIVGVQFEIASAATQFTRAGGTLQGELAACQRYYYRTSPNASGSPVTNTGGILTTTIGQVYVSLPVTMRNNPASMDYSAINWYNFGNNTEYNTGTFTLTAATPNLASVRYTHGSAIFTTGQVGAFTSAGSSSYLGFSAEL
jgi:hypothetical protein